MAFWAKKKSDPDLDKKDAGNHLLKKKDDKKGAPPRRIDNLRIAQKLNITLKSLGTGNEYRFLTKDLSSTGMFVLCNEHKRYPFIPQSTIIETIVNLEAKGDDEIHQLRCLCKIMRIVEGTPQSPMSGYGMRIIQISTEQRNTLEQFIAKHGSPENFVPYSGGDGLEDSGTFASPPVPKTTVNGGTDEIGMDTHPTTLSDSA